MLVLKSGLKTLVLKKCESGILVGPAGRLESVLATLMAAAKAGELDGALEAASGAINRVGTAKALR